MRLFLHDSLMTIRLHRAEGIQRKHVAALHVQRDIRKRRWLFFLCMHWWHWVDLPLRGAYHSFGVDVAYELNVIVWVGEVFFWTTAEEHVDGLIVSSRPERGTQASITCSKGVETQFDVFIDLPELKWC